jgi:hypothetical protein
MLPLRPGSYSWLVSLYNDHEEIDVWECAPEMIVATENFQHHFDEWNGLLNIPSEFRVVAIHPKEDSARATGQGKPREL